MTYTMRLMMGWMIILIGMGLPGRSRGDVLVEKTLRDGSLPAGWEQADVDFRTTAGGFALLETTDAELVTPAIDGSAYAFIRVAFAVAKFGSGDNGPVAVESRLSGAAAWTAIGDSPVPTSSDPYERASLDIFTVSDTMQVRFVRADSPSQKRLRDVTITGVGTAGEPMLQVTPAALSGLDYLVGAGPSESASYALTAFNLSGVGNITASAPSAFEIATEADGVYTASVQVPFADGVITGQPVTLHVRLASGRSAGSYAGTITHTGGGVASPPVVTLDGSVAGVIMLSPAGYTEAFDGIEGGLPAGVRVVTGATLNVIGSDAAFDPAAKTWADSAGAFKNLASTVGLTDTAASVEQAASADRALGVRTTSSFGDPGAAIVFTLGNTVGYASIDVAMELLMVSVQGRSQVWTVDYRVGENGDFIVLGTWPDPGAWGTTPFSATLGTDADNQPAPVHIRVATLGSSTGGGSRDTIAIDNLALTAASADRPTITAAPAALSAFETVAGSPSEPQSFTVRGSNLTGDLTVNAPAGFELSAFPTDGFVSGLTLTATGGAVAETNLNARMAGTLVGTFSGQIEIAGGGAVPRAIAVEGVASLAVPATLPASAIERYRFTANWTAVPGATGYEIDVATAEAFDFGGSESFDNHTATGSYGSGSYTGDYGVVWHYVESRNDAGYSIADKGILMRYSNTHSRVYSELVPGGIGSFSCRLRKGFTGAGNRQVELFINGESLGKSEAFDDTEIRTFTVTDINIEGDIEIRVDNATAHQVVIDDIYWTAYPPSVLPAYNKHPVAGTSTAVGGLERDTTYYYRVRATGGGLVGDWSDGRAVTTQRRDPPILFIVR